MAECFGIPVDDREKEKEKKNSDDRSDTGEGNKIYFEGADKELMEEAATDVDDEHDDELVTIYDKENPQIVVGKLFPSMDEFRMCFKTYAIKKEFDAKTKWTDRKKFYARCSGFDGGARPWKWYISARRQPDGATIRVNQIPHVHTCITSSHNVTSMTSQAWVAEDHSYFSQDTKHYSKEA